jgi:ER membrane protein complex subunit 2
VEFLESNSTDAEAWRELAELYHYQGMIAQAMYSIEEALLIAPNAWNVCHIYPS